MGSAPSDGSGDVPLAPFKILDRRRLRGGQDHARRRDQRGPAAAHRGGPDPGERRHRRPDRRRQQDHDDGRDGLRLTHHGHPSRAVPVRHARPGTLLVHVGRAVVRRARRRGPGRHPPTRRLASLPSTTSRGGSLPFIVAINCFDGAPALRPGGRADRARPRPAGPGHSLRRPPARLGQAGPDHPGRARPRQQDQERLGDCARQLPGITPETA